ncbi:MAG: aldo/keto reductase [Christensenellaceae bacterium]|nr:aldo/keto reductase [Christensenellaceae bacterium]
MPLLGFGSVFVEDPETIIWGINKGLRNIDTATDYGNEAVVGEAVRGCGLDRKDVFVTTKLWNSSQGYYKTMKAFEKSLKTMGLDYIDLYLIHWPCPNHDLYIDSWKAMEQLYKEGLVRAIGVSNFYEELLERIKKECEIIPMVNQIEYHPYNQHVSLTKYCRENNIQLEAYMPIARAKVLKDPAICKIGENNGKNGIQVTLRWLMQEGICAIPRSANKDRIVSNADIYDFELTEEDMQIIRGLNEDLIMCEDPKTFHETKNLDEQIADKIARGEAIPEGMLSSSK